MTAAPDRLFLEFQAAVAGRYSIERQLGRGGMGVVYLAREVRLDRDVALKLLPPTLATQPALRERFLREARTAAKLSHPHIIPIHAVDEAGDFVFFAMAYVAGGTLTERVRARGPLSAADAGRLLREVAWALAYAHAQGVIHRDVKPDNIMLEDGTGRALVTDFGIAGQVSGAATLDGGDVVGTPEFMSPEQALGEGVDARSDLYALGAVGYFALSGQFPFQGAKATEVLAKQITQTPRPLSELVDSAPRKLVQAVERCLAKEPAERPQKAEDLAEQLGLALERRKETPVPLRVFVKRTTQVGGAVALVYVYMLTIITTALGFAAPPGLRAAAVLGSLAGGLLVVPAGLLVLQARRLLKLGFGREDLIAAFVQYLELGREERIFEYGRGPSLFERVTRVLAVAGVGVGVLAAALGWTSFVAPIAIPIGVLSGLFWVNRLQHRTDLNTRIWTWIWKGRLGRWLFRIAGRLAPARTGIPAFTQQPTELALGLASERLYEDLPKETRRQLREVPEVLRRLEADAGRMRRRLDQLNDALGDIHGGETTGDADGVAARHGQVVADLEKEREEVQQRLKSAVAALETIRLNLLKLHAGTGSVQSLTTDLTLARQAAEEVDRLLQSHREVEEGL